MKRYNSVLRSSLIDYEIQRDALHRRWRDSILRMAVSCFDSGRLERSRQLNVNASSARDEVARTNHQDVYC